MECPATRTLIISKWRPWTPVEYTGIDSRIARDLDQRKTRNTENELDTIILIDTDSPRLTVTPGKCHASYGGTQIRCDLRQNLIPQL